jgi:hypothetical protein
MANCKSAGFLVPKGNPFDYGMRNIKMQERLRTSSDCVTMFLEYPKSAKTAPKVLAQQAPPHVTAILTAIHNAANTVIHISSFLEEQPCKNERASMVSGSLLITAIATRQQHSYPVNAAHLMFANRWGIQL